MHELLEPFSAHYNIPSGNKPNDISGVLTVLKPGVSIINNWLADSEDRSNEMDTISDLLEYENVQIQ